MSTATKAPECCGVQLKVVKDQGTGIFSYTCAKCGRSSSGKTPAEAGAAWGGIPAPGPNQPPKQAGHPVPAIPTAPGQLYTWGLAHMAELTKSSAAFLEKPATSRMIQKNLKHVARQDGLEKVWASSEGRESIVEALEESFLIGATLPEMGSIVPYGDMVEFIPSVEAYNFALTTGRNAPFEWIAIECIHENDKCKRSRVNGNFQIEFEHMPNQRGEVVAIAVYGKEKQRGIVVGEIYEKDRLLEKAKAHSPSYKYYQGDIAAINAARAEGKLKIENGREYIEKVMPKKDGSTWPKKVFLDSTTNPYEGPDQPEMLKKTAGKSFFRPWMKVRNSVEMAGEWTEGELDDEDSMGVIDGALSRAKESVKPSSAPAQAPAQENIKDAEFEVQESEPVQAAQPVSPKMDDRI